MARDDRFKKYQEAGADFLETARVRAEEFLRELSKVSGSTQRQGRDALDDLVDESRKGTEQVIASIRNEIRSQLSLLGLATKEDLAALERRLGGSASKSTATKKAAASKSTSSKTASTRKATAKKASGSSKSASSSKTAAKRSTPAKKTTGRA